MPFEVTWSGRGYYKRVYGAVSAVDFLQSITKVQNHPDFDSLRFGINDFLGVESFQLTPSDIDLYAATSIGASISNPRMQIAIVATDPRIIAMVKAYAQLAPFPTEFFETPDAAHQWVRSLGLETTVQ
jgi:hypothetical protein